MTVAKKGGVSRVCGASRGGMLTRTDRNCSPKEGSLQTGSVSRAFGARSGWGVGCLTRMDRISSPKGGSFKKSSVSRALGARAGVMANADRP